MAKKYAFKGLQKIHAKLHGPEGCAWDKQQTIDDAKQFMLNEVNELKKAVEAKDWENMKEELGDVLHIILFMAAIAGKENRFTFDDVVQGICDKLVRRHPHVFGKMKLTDPDKIMELWDEIKREEKRQKKAKITPTKAIVFDWDGVIVDSLSVNLRTYREIERRMGRKIYPGKLNKDHIDLEWRKNYLAWGVKEEEISLIQEIYKECQHTFDDQIKAYPEILPVIHQLGEKYKLAIISSNYASYITKKLDRLGIAQHFSVILGGENHVTKPNPEVIRQCAERLGVDPSEIVFVGDMDKEISMAKRAGVKRAIASIYGFHSKRRLLAVEPDALISSPLELLKHVE